MKRILQATIIFALIFGAYANALPIKPKDAVLDSTACGVTVNPKNNKEESNCGPSMTEIYDYLEGLTSIDFHRNDLLYKSDAQDDGTGIDDGPFAHLYTTTFSPTDDSSKALSAATISWNKGQYLSEVEWLLVKDGGGTPIWYLFDLITLGWNGMENLELSEFWLEKGSISNVSFYGPPTVVPEPGTLALLGIGLLGAAFLRRKIAA